MQLLAVHQVLIAAAVGLGAIFGLRSIVMFSRGGGAMELALGAVSALVVAGLVVYLGKVRARWHEARAATATRRPRGS